VTGNGFLSCARVAEPGVPMMVGATSISEGQHKSCRTRIFLFDLGEAIFPSRPRFDYAAVSKQAVKDGCRLAATRRARP
jgi:hypothetical protein